MNIGLRIKELRKKMNLTQAEFSKKANISRSYLSDVENNRYNPSIDTLENIATHLEVSLNEFFEGDYISKTKETPSIFEGANQDTLIFLDDLKKIGINVNDFSKKEYENFMDTIKAIWKMKES